MKHRSAVGGIRRWNINRKVRNLTPKIDARRLIGQQPHSQIRPVLFLVHGAWHGAWIWTKVERELTARGWVVHTIDLPSVAERGRPRSGLYNDALSVRRRIEDIEAPVVVVAHCYGGAVVTQGVGDLPNVRHIVYVSAFALDVGESILELAGCKPDWWIVDGEIMTPANPRAVFYHDVEQLDAEWAIAHLRPFSFVAVTHVLTTAAWRRVPSTYIVCDFDAAIGPAQEFFAQRATHTRRLPSSHSPMISMPAELVELIAEASNAP